MTASILQFLTAEDPSGASFATTISITLTGVTAGSSIWLATRHQGGPGTVDPTVSDSVNGSWPSPLIDKQEFAFSNCTYTFKYLNSSAGSPVITITFDGNASGKCIAAAEIGGVSTSALDGHAINNQGGAGNTGTDAITSGTVANANQPGILIALNYDISNGTTPSTVVGTGFTNLGLAWANGVANPLARFEYKHATALNGAATFTLASGANTGDNYATHAAFFDEGGGGGGGATNKLAWIRA